MRLLNRPTFPSAGLLSLRVVVGVTFLLHGLDKLGASRARSRGFSLDGALDLPRHLAAAGTRTGRTDAEVTA